MLTIKFNKDYRPGNKKAGDELVLKTASRFPSHLADFAEEVKGEESQGDAEEPKEKKKSTKPKK